MQTHEGLGHGGEGDGERRPSQAVTGRGAPLRGDSTAIGGVEHAAFPWSWHDRRPRGSLFQLRSLSHHHAAAEVSSLELRIALFPGLRTQLLEGAEAEHLEVVRQDICPVCGGVQTEAGEVQTVITEIDLLLACAGVGGAGPGEYRAVPLEGAAAGAGQSLATDAFRNQQLEEPRVVLGFEALAFPTINTARPGQSYSFRFHHPT